MENFTTNQIILMIIGIASFIVTLGGATSVIRTWWINSRGTKNQEKIVILSKRVESVELKEEILEQHQQDTEEFSKIMCKSMLALLNHEITGSSVEKLKEAEEDIKAYLINK